MKPLASLSIVVILFAAGFSQAASIFAPAVTTDGKGILAVITVTATNGTGRVYSDVSEELISQDTQKSMRDAVKAANATNFDILISIKAGSESVDGSSGGLAMALLTVSETTGRKLRKDFAVTGAIDEKGQVGEVGGVLEKLQAMIDEDAKNPGAIRVFGVPLGQALYQGVDLRAFGSAKGVQVVEFENLGEAMKVAFSPEGSEVKETEREEKKLEVIPYNYSEKASVLRALSQSIRKSLSESIKEVNSTALLKVLNKSLYDSMLLEEKGYFYSSANTAFTALAQAESYKLVSTGISRKELDKMAGEVERKARETKLPGKTKNNWEWVVGGELRLNWALKRLEEMKGTKALSEAIDYLVTARAWAEAAPEIGNLGDASGAAIDDGNYREFSKQLLDAARDSSIELDPEAEFHLNASVAEFDNGQFLASAFDSAFAIASAKAFNEIEGKTISEAEKDLSKDDKSAFASAWAELYYSHALYNTQEFKTTPFAGNLLNAAKMKELSNALDAIAAQVALGTVETNWGLKVQVQSEMELPKPTWVYSLAIVALLILGYAMAKATWGRKKKTQEKQTEQTTTVTSQEIQSSEPKEIPKVQEEPKTLVKVKAAQPPKKKLGKAKNRK